MTDSPIAFVTFNRPDSAVRSFERIREARPSKLFLVSDGPRPDRPGEAELVQQTRAVGQQVDWPCDVHPIYSEENLGCAKRISSAISEAFTQVDRLVVIEDDCVAHRDFFPYCDDLLERYADDQRIMAVSGNNFQRGHFRTHASYYFSAYPHCWGWATWRDAWEKFDLGISHWPAFRDNGFLGGICTSPQELEYWTEIFDRCHAGSIDSWAFPWTLCCWMNHGLTALPHVNLVRNIGFGQDATHTRKHSEDSTMPTESLGPMVHPKYVARHFEADQYTDTFQFSGVNRTGMIKKFRRRLGITSQRRRAA